ncbi:MAG TPA: HD domain-containing phosphohydrolase [Candidatus Limnocylindria bacterium]|nr:HD domain-containing phosphohydrolase [Candidatus Limnocylindria bacterium]
MVILSVISVVNVTAQLDEQSRRQIQQTSREVAMTILGQLTSLDSEMRSIGSTLESGAQLTFASPPAGLAGRPEDRFKGLEIVTDKGARQVIYGKVAIELEYSEDERKFLHSGNTLLSTRSCSKPVPCVFLSQELSKRSSGNGALVAEVNASRLWNADNLPPLIDMCVLDEAGRALYCPKADPSQFPSNVASSFSGEFEWKNGGQEYLSDYWSAPLKPRFFASHWTVIASEARSDVLAPLNHFKRIFLLTVLLAFWVVLFLSLIQIRRTMVPLARLQAGTRRVTSGDFAARVAVPGTDEFAELGSSFNFMATRIEKHVNWLKAISEIDRAILSSWDSEQIVNALVVGLHSLFRYELASISLVDPNSTLRASNFVVGAEAAGNKHVTTIALSADESAALSQHPDIAILNPGETVPSYLALLAQHGMSYFLVVPIVLKGKLAAIISLAHGSASIWSQEDKQQAAQLADQVAVAITNARLVEELKKLHLGTLTALARAIDAKSHWTAGHSERVTKWAMRIARAMGLPEEELEIIHRGGLLHDIGKIGTPMAILDKPGKLTDQEMQQMREHVRIGARILQPIPGFTECMPIILQHHEWIDGSGYPEGLAGEEISLHARIFAVADCYDALISHRPYRPGMSPERVEEIIRGHVGKQFDSAVVEKFFNLLEQENKNQAAQDISSLPVGVA